MWAGGRRWGRWLGQQPQRASGRPSAATGTQGWMPQLFSAFLHSPLFTPRRHADSCPLSRHRVAAAAALCFMSGSCVGADTPRSPGRDRVSCAARYIVTQVPFMSSQQRPS